MEWLLLTNSLREMELQFINFADAFVGKFLMKSQEFERVRLAFDRFTENSLKE